MAQKAKKGVAKANVTTLNNLHIGTLTVNVVFILFNLLWKRRSHPLSPNSFLRDPAAQPSTRPPKPSRAPEKILLRRD